MTIKCIAAMPTAWLAAVLMAATPAAAAADLSFQPAIQQAQPNTGVSLNLTISGLGDFQAPSLGVFDIDVSFDPQVLTFDSYELGGFMGDQQLGDMADFSFGQTASSTVNLSALSYLEPESLSSTQPASFILATLHFSVHPWASGATTVVGVDQVLALGDAFGRPLTVDAMASATIAVVPEPAASLMMLLGLAGTALALRRLRRV